jgi:hypothetical protein
MRLHYVQNKTSALVSKAIYDTKLDSFNILRCCIVCFPISFQSYIIAMRCYVGGIFKGKHSWQRAYYAQLQWLNYCYAHLFVSIVLRNGFAWRVTPEHCESDKNGRGVNQYRKATRLCSLRWTINYKFIQQHTPRALQERMQRIPRMNAMHQSLSEYCVCALIIQVRARYYCD